MIEEIFSKYESYLNPLLEAVPISSVKKYVQAWKDAGMDSYLNDWFGNSDRIYIPLNKASEEIIKSEAWEEIEILFKLQQYEIVNYFEGYAKKKNDRNLIRIGKVLNMLHRPDLLRMYENDELREFYKDKPNEMIVIISRHPYDIAGMSSNRRWTSCMNLFKQSANNDEYGELSVDPDHYILMDVLNGTLIAYLTDTKDRNINNPIGRILIKPFINTDNPDDIILVPEQKVYGINVSGFYDTVQSWLDLKQGIRSGEYIMNCNLYNDTGIHAYKNPDDDTTINKFMKFSGIETHNYEIKTSPDGLKYVNVFTDFNLLVRPIREIPIRFGVVKGNFIANGNMLTSFKNFPIQVYGDVNVSDNDIKNFVNCPTFIGGDLKIQKNKLKSVEGFPNKIGKSIYINQEYASKIAKRFSDRITLDVIGK